MTTRRYAALIWIAAMVMFATASPAAAKGKPNCRNLSFTGQAGACMPPDLVQIRIVDALGDEIHRSCNNVQVQPGETALHFGARMPRDLGSDGDGDCGAHILEPDPPTKQCLNGTGGSCKYKWKGKKQVLEVCCWQDQNCSGLKVGNYCNGGTTPLAKCTSNADCPGGGVCKLRTGTQGISAQKQIQGTDPAFAPTPVPVGVVDLLVQLDPIGMTQLPFPALGSCRTALGKAATGLASTAIDTLVGCHAQRLKGAPIADCNSINAQSDPSGRIADAAAALTAAALTCTPGGSPFALGYHGCPAPCASTVVNTCAAGMIGAACSADADCDSSVGAGDGACGRHQDWSALGACAACVVESAVTSAVVDKYGTVGPGLPDDEIKCQDEIGKTLASLIRTQVSVTTKCQKLLDGGKMALAFCQQGQCVAPAAKVGAPCAGEDDCVEAEARRCKYADQSSIRRLAEAKAHTEIDKGCLATDLTNLDSCDVTLAGLEDCVVQNARDAGVAIADAIFPEGIGHTPCVPGPPCATPTPTATPTPGGSAPAATATPSSACPSAVEFEELVTGAPLDQGWSGRGHDERLVSSGKVTLAVTGCANTMRPCGVCNLAGPVPNVDAGAGGLANHRCAGDTSVRCATAADCAVAGGTCEFFQSSYLPLDSADVVTCTSRRVAGPASGTADIESGASTLLVSSLWTVYDGLSVISPCPQCVGDPSANDSIAAGTCQGGKRNGLPCDANGFSGTIFFGSTSLDCPPNDATFIGTQSLKIASTTGSVAATLSAASPQCRAAGFTALQCFCDTCNSGPFGAQMPCMTNADCVDPLGPIGPVCGGKRCIGGTNEGAACSSASECPGGGACSVPGRGTAPNECDDQTCSPNPVDPDGPNEGTCAAGPVESFCGPPDTNLTCNIDADCAIFPGTTCLAKFRNCYPDNGVLGGSVHASGAPGAPVNDVAMTTHAALFCEPPVPGGANTYNGLPGLGRLEVPMKVHALP